MTPGQILAKITKLREQKDTHTKKVSALNQQIDDLCNELIAQMDQAGTDQIRNTNYTASITEKKLPSIEDDERFYRWVHRNWRDARAIFMRRPNPAVVRDLEHARGGRPIPGLKMYIQRGLSVKKTRS